MDESKQGIAICIKILTSVFGDNLGGDWFSITGSGSPLWVCVGKAPGCKIPLLEDFESFVSVYVDEEKTVVDSFKLPGFDLRDKDKLQSIIDNYNQKPQIQNNPPKE